MKARDSFVVRYGEERVNWEKKQDGENIYILKLPGNRFWLTSKMFMDDLLSNGLHEKVMICLFKVD